MLIHQLLSHAIGCGQRLEEENQRLQQRLDEERKDNREMRRTLHDLRRRLAAQDGDGTPSDAECCQARPAELHETGNGDCDKAEAAFATGAAVGVAAGLMAGRRG